MKPIPAETNEKMIANGWHVDQKLLVDMAMEACKGSHITNPNIAFMDDFVRVLELRGFVEIGKKGVEK